MVMNLHRLFAGIVFISAAVSLRAQPIDIAKAKVVDLTHPFDDKTIYWPTSPTAFELKSLASGQTPGGWYYASNSLCTPEHGGTHLDAPLHFSKDGRSTDQVPPRQLVAPAAVLDVSA